MGDERSPGRATAQGGGDVAALRQQLADGERARAELERRLAESERTRRSLAEALFETMQRVGDVERKAPDGRPDAAVPAGGTGAAPASDAPAPGGSAALEATVARLQREIDELRIENDFLSGEVARYGQKNRELLAKVNESSEK